MSKQLTIDNAPLHALQRKALDTSLTFLQSLPGVSYLVKLPDGTELTHGDMRVKVLKANGKGTRVLRQPFGTFSTFVRSKGIADLQIGQVLTIDPAPHSALDIRSAANSLAALLWGNKSASTCITNGVVEILRVK